MTRTTHLQRASLTLLLTGLLCGPANAASTPLDAKASDPQVMGWMRGFPPAADCASCYNASDTSGATDHALFEYLQEVYCFENERSSGSSSPS